MMWPFRKKPEERKARQPVRQRRPGRIVTNLGVALSDAMGNDQTFKVETRPIAEIIKSTLTTDRGKMRHLEECNDYAVRWLTEQEENVIGGNGFRFQSAVMRANGDFNKPINDKIEALWQIQSHARNYTIEGEHSAVDETAADKLILRSVARDGFCFVVIHENAMNDTGFAIEILPGDILDHELIINDWRGGMICNGVEVRGGKVVAYHVGSKRGMGTGSIDPNHTRLDAANIIFPFVRTCPGQYVGRPWAKSVMSTLHGLDQYEEAVLTASREAACKALFYTQDPENPIGDLTEADLSGEVEPGMATLLPPGVQMQAYDPSQPGSTYSEYRKGVLMRASSGLNMSYQSLSGDLSGGNFASQRVGLLDEREIWKGRQTWYVNAVKRRIYSRWLRVVRVNANGWPESLTPEAMDHPVFRGRRWTWVDPLKDLQAAKLAVDSGFSSREKVIADSDSDTDEEGVLRAIKRGNDLAEEMGLTFTADPAKTAKAVDGEGDNETATQEEDETKRFKVI